MNQIIRDFHGVDFKITEAIQDYVFSGYKIISMVSPAENHVIVVFEMEETK